MDSTNVSNARTGAPPGALSAQLNRSLQELQHLAEVYHQHGHTDEAREVYRMIIRIKENQQNDSDLLKNKQQTSL
jgi:hypothetical protein